MSDIKIIRLADVAPAQPDPITQARALALEAARIVDDDCTAERIRWRLDLALQILDRERP